MSNADMRRGVAVVGRLFVLPTLLKLMEPEWECGVEPLSGVSTTLPASEVGVTCSSSARSKVSRSRSSDVRAIDSRVVWTT